MDNSDGADCLVGDIMYLHGESIGYIGETCIDDTNFSGTESFCRNGEIADEILISAQLHQSLAKR